MAPARSGAEGDRTESRLLDALRAGDEAAFLELVDRHHASMVRVARLFVPERPAAAEVVQEAWIGVQRGRGLPDTRADGSEPARAPPSRPLARPPRARRLFPHQPVMSYGGG